MNSRLFVLLNLLPWYMTITELYRCFTDAEFQYNRFLKTKDFNRANLERYDELIESIRNQASKMDLSPGINEEVHALGRIEIDFAPKVSFFVKILSVLSFGWYKRNFIRKSSLQYFTAEIHKRHLLVQSIQNHLNEE